MAVNHHSSNSAAERNFPELSPAVLNALTDEALRAIRPDFYGLPICNYNVLGYYENMCREDEATCENEEECIQRLQELGLSQTRLATLQRNMVAMASIFGTDKSDLWTLYSAPRIITWILEDAMWSPASCSSGRSSSSRSDGNQVSGERRGGASGDGAAGRAGGDGKSCPDRGPVGGIGGGRAGGSGGGRGGGGFKSDGSHGPPDGPRRKEPRDTKRLRFPEEKERYFADAEAFFSSDPLYPEFEHVIEFSTSADIERHLQCNVDY